MKASYEHIYNELLEELQGRYYRPWHAFLRQAVSIPFPAARQAGQLDWIVAKGQRRYMGRFYARDGRSSSGPLRSQGLQRLGT
jgi:hypothetical protein